ncbi:hypothetical protein PBT90_19710 [Algoriphagus halophytocola]|uniref:Lipoprotein n=1 Tax=Algoriphagus halophytocola TaxID=2991499 RepID=A0ABY6MHT7_9BACT|nr:MULTISPECIES: hypothetical protein [unclassified Algoriphagus]UZD21744.1 hypothetical protein OM944_13845 [Algoriphagus sp. TR-M5]WBL42956.1 hypothetical protein PBT90_19710 [Algoriphagus sp. TR-M9]
MYTITYFKGFSFFFLGLSLLFFASCSDTLESEVVAYSNNFSDADLAGFENGRLQIFENDTVVGYYHNEEIAVNLSGLPSHNMLKVTIDVLIHDSWDGNQSGYGSGPDQWFFGVDSEEVFRTTFSNTPCESTYCLYQSYPDNYFKQNVPKSGAVQTNLPGLCIFGPVANYTSRYSISKIIEHSNSSARIYMNSDLVAENSPDPFCDESWSLAEITVEALIVK